MDVPRRPTDVSERRLSENRQPTPKAIRETKRDRAVKRFRFWVILGLVLALALGVSISLVISQDHELDRQAEEAKTKTGGGH